METRVETGYDLVFTIKVMCHYELILLDNGLEHVGLRWFFSRGVGSMKTLFLSDGDFDK